jgi:DNA polymerase-3 subunit delta
MGEHHSAPAAGKGSCFLFLGPELGEKDTAIAELRRSLGAGQAGALEETSLYVGETPVSDISAALRNGSLFSDTRLFFIKNAELVKKKDELDLLGSALKSLQPGTVAVLVSDETKVAKALEDAAPPSNKRIFWELFENRKNLWLRDFFAGAGGRISEEGIAAILELVENNTAALKQECERLIQFFGTQRVIGAEEVEEWLSHTREESPFTLFSRIAAGDLSKCMESLHALLGAREPIQTILGGLAWCFRRLRDYQALAESRPGPAEAGGISDFEFKKIGLGSLKSRGDYIQAGRRYGPGAGDRFLALIAEYDVRLRSGGGALETLFLEMFLYKIVSSAIVRGSGRPRGAP